MPRELSLTTACLALIAVAGGTMLAIQGARAIDQSHRVAECLAAGWDQDQCHNIRPSF
ncbi:MAG: hypothetical protein RLZZ168_170 [Cyanobacteriota bacterium]|jgi:uncharacterized membrane protein